VNVRQILTSVLVIIVVVALLMLLFEGHINVGKLVEVSSIAFAVALVSRLVPTTRMRR
jgi:hypothetical protein